MSNTQKKKWEEELIIPSVAVALIATARTFIYVG